MDYDNPQHSKGSIVSLDMAKAGVNINNVFYDFIMISLWFHYDFFWLGARICLCFFFFFKILLCFVLMMF